MNTQDERFATEMHAVLRKARDMSVAILVATAFLSIATVSAVTVYDLQGFTALALTASVVMSAWVTRRVILEIPQHRKLLEDRRLTASRNVVASMIVIDAAAFLISTAASLWLLSHLMNVD